MKQITIRISKHKIDAHIDARTYKRVNASMPNLAESEKDTIASDSSENLDFGIIAELRTQRAASLRESLMQYLSHNGTATDALVNAPDSPSEANIEYVFEVADSFSQADVNALGSAIFNYLIRSILFDWYSRLGVATTETAEALSLAVDNIKKMLLYRPLPPVTRPLTNNS